MASDTGNEVASAVASELAKIFITETRRQFGYIIHYHRNIKSCKQQIQNLEAIYKDVELSTAEAETNGEDITHAVQLWLQNVGSILHEGVEESNGCLSGRCPNLKTRYQLSKKAERKIVEAGKLENEANFQRISFPKPPLGVGVRSSTDFKHFESRTPVVEKMMKLLKDDTNHIISICGMGGLGKTQMVEELSRIAEGENLFDEVVMVVVSENLDLMKIQTHIAARLHFELKETIFRERADRLWQRLQQGNKRRLVILDDVWEEFGLNEVGIPIGVIGGSYCKVVMTSRNKDVCEFMGCLEIVKIGFLTDPEAWCLFRDIAGDTVAAPDLYMTASKVVKKCGGLPIALVILGKALRGQRKWVWEYTLVQLQEYEIPTNVTGVEKQVYRSVQLSINLLNSPESTKIFLLCCLLPEDTNIPIEDLVRYGVGLELFKADTLELETSMVRTVVDKLKSRFLLLDGNERHTVKVHDFVRVVGIAMAVGNGQTIENFRIAVMHNAQWSKVGGYETCNAISILSKVNFELPPGQSDFAKLELLHLSCDGISLGTINNMFDRMKELKVVHMVDMRFSSLPRSLQLLLKSVRVLYIRLEALEEFKLEHIKQEELLNVKILSLGSYVCSMLPQEIKRFSTLRSLDMRGCRGGWTISPGVISSLCQLEELHTGFYKWEEYEENDAQAILADIESLPNLSYLGIALNHARQLFKYSFFGKLKRYVIVAYSSKNARYDFPYPGSFMDRTIGLHIDSNLRSLGGGLEKLLGESVETLLLRGDGVSIALNALVQGGSPELSKLTIEECASTLVEYLNSTVECIPHDFGVFYKLEKLCVRRMHHLKGLLCHNTPQLGSFLNLKEMELFDLPALTHVFTVSTAKCLVNLQSLIVHRCHTMKNILVNEGISTINESSVIEFPRLHIISLMFANSLTSFYQGIGRVEFPCLKKLDFKYLPQVRSFCVPNGSDTFFDEKVTFPTLETLSLESLPKIKELWRRPSSVECFHKLKSFRIIKCDNLLVVFPSTLNADFSSLEELLIHYCDSLEVVFGIKSINFKKLVMIHVGHCNVLRNLFSPTSMMKVHQETSTSGNNIIELPNLEELHLRSLSNFTCVCEMSDLLRFPNLERLQLNHLPELQSLCLQESSQSSEASFGTLFYKQVTFPRLEELDLENVPQIKELWRGQFSIECFQKLRSLKISCSDGLVNIFPSTLDVVFKSLEVINLYECASLERVFGVKTINFGKLKVITVGGCGMLKNLFSPASTTTANIVIELPNLYELNLRNLERFTCICEGSSVVRFPNLENLELVTLPQLRSFCSQVSSQALEDSHTNADFHTIFNGQVIFPSLQTLVVSGLCKIKELWRGHFDSGCFQKVRAVEVSYCEELVNLFSSSLEPISFPCLENLEIESCDSLEQLFAEEAIDLGNLQVVTVKGCPKLRNLFSSSVLFKRLPHLREIDVRGCENMEEIVAKEEEKEEGKESCNLPLQELSLVDLPRLKCFLDTKYVLDSLMLERIFVKGCSETSCFSMGLSWDDVPSVTKEVCLQNLEAVSPRSRRRRI